MNFTLKLLKFIPLLPGLIQAVEGLFLKGEDKKQQVMDFVSLGLDVSSAVANKDIVDHNAFMDGVNAATDGIVKMLNASIWHKSKQ